MQMLMMDPSTSRLQGRERIVTVCATLLLLMQSRKARWMDIMRKNHAIFPSAPGRSPCRDCFAIAGSGKIRAAALLLMGKVVTDE
jgi:hypothetical protein